MIVEYLRGLAALAVAWFHLTDHGRSWVSAMGEKGWLGVEVFFVISGFIIPYSILRKFPRYSLDDFPRFVLRRMMRLEPPYIASVILVIALWQLSALAPGFHGDAPSYEKFQVAAHLLYVIPLTDYSWLQPVYWTLAYEFAFYLFIGIMFPPLCGSKKQLAWLIVATMAGFGVAVGYLPTRSLLFSVGLAVYRRMAHRDSGGVAIIGLCAAIMIYRGDGAIAATGLATGAAIYWGGRVDVPGVLGWGLRGLGAISYSLYLTHVPIGGRIVNLGRRFIDGPWQELFLSIAALAVCVVFAAAFWMLVERPAIAFARRMVERPRPIAERCELI